MKKIILFASYSVLVGILPASAEVNCMEVSAVVNRLVSSNQSKLLEIVADQVVATPSCACEVVKAAIEGSKADSETIATIVDTAIMVSPDNMRLISQCAIAAAPDSVTAVQAVLAKYDPNSGDIEISAKDSKAPAGEVAALPNPLDFPGKGPVRPLFPILPPVIINTPKVSQVNPGVPVLSSFVASPPAPIFVALPPTPAS